MFHYIINTNTPAPDFRTGSTPVLQGMFFFLSRLSAYLKFSAQRTQVLVMRLPTLSSRPTRLLYSFQKRGMALLLQYYLLVKLSSS